MSSNRYTVKDEQGFPVLFSTENKREIQDDSPEIVTPDSTSGPAEWGRYHDAVREAARSFDKPNEGDIRHFLNARARHPERVDIPAFHEAVKRARHADLVDILDSKLRSQGSLQRGARMVRVQAPHGFVKRSLRQSSPEEIAHIRHRLTAVGHDSTRVDSYLRDRVAPDMWDQASSLEVKMTDSEFDGLTFDDSGDFEDDWEHPLEDVLDALSNIKPEIHIHIDPKLLDASDIEG